MVSLSNFLNKFLRLEKDNMFKQVVVLDIVNRVAKVNLSKEMLQIKNEELRIVCSPVFRNEIFMHKQEIEDSFKSQNIFLKII